MDDRAPNINLYYERLVRGADYGARERAIPSARKRYSNKTFIYYII